MRKFLEKTVFPLKKTKSCMWKVILLLYAIHSSLNNIYFNNVNTLYWFK